MSYSGKRLFDLVVGGTALIAFLPLMILVFLIVRLFLGTPVIYRQFRPGLRGELFGCLKFRTMTNDRDKEGSLLPDAQRLTPVGRLLRSLSLDELPELINVMRGEMSLVGPRPLLARYLPLYSQTQMRRHDVKPGITGWAQINGRNHLDWDQKFDLDLWYVDHQSFWLDVSILIKTIVQVFRRDGIANAGHATMPEFQGVTRQNRSS